VVDRQIPTRSPHEPPHPLGSWPSPEEATVVGDSREREVEAGPRGGRTPPAGRRSQNSLATPLPDAAPSEPPPLPDPLTDPYGQLALAEPDADAEPEAEALADADPDPDALVVAASDPPLDPEPPHSSKLRTSAPSSPHAAAIVASASARAATVVMR
jgi:phosphatidylglycerol---prolipoprotein diacylglyceryl transferase